MCRFIIQDIFLGTVLVQWSHIQVKFEEFQGSTGTEHSSLSLINLTCDGTQRSSLTSWLLCLWLAVSNAHFPVLSRKPSESVKTRISMAHISKTKTNFSKIPSKLFSGLQNLVIEVNLSRRFSWPLRMKIKYCQKQRVNKQTCANTPCTSSKCIHKKGFLCAPYSSRFFGTPCIRTGMTSWWRQHCVFSIRLLNLPQTIYSIETFGGW